jgi:outer membrane receptor protein involved in Fe transport
MSHRKAALYCAAAAIALGPVATGGALAQTNSGSSSSGIETVVVTAQKTLQNINDVGMSIQAASGDDLVRLGITDPSQLDKIVPGFNYTPSFYGTPIYSIRGVGFLDTSLAASPTVSVYTDEVPLPYSILTSGASLDLQRVEVLKGPQGTLFGENATGGAINYIAAKPTDDWEAGADLSYGRFNTVDLDGYVSGPITDDLNFRVALRTLQGGDWQQSYTHPATWGAPNFYNGRVALAWQPNQDFKALLTVSGFRDQGDTQMPALYGIAVLSPTSGLDPRIRNYPDAPHDDRAADWSACVNASPFDPPFDTTPIGATKPTTSTSCVPARKDNKFFSVSLRMDYNLGDDITLTSLTAHERLDRYTAIEGDGTIYQDYESIQHGFIDVTYQELRLAGKFDGKGDWIFGANFEGDGTYDHFLQTYGGSTANPTALPGAALCATPGFCTGVNLAGVPLFYLTTLGPTQPTNREHTQSMAVFANGEYPIFDSLTAQLGARFTQTNKDSQGCGNDGGDGTWSTVSQEIQDLLEVLHGSITPAQYLQPGASPGGNGINPGPGACATTGPGPSFHPQPFFTVLNQNNVSWRAGLNWKPVDDTLLYFNVSQGWKAGSFPTVATSAYTQLVPARQEGLLAFEAGFKSTLFDGTLQANGAIFYYDYKDKQLLGAIVDPVFGPLPALVNVPKSHVEGFELTGVWAPIDGLTISPGVSFTESRVDGCAPAGPNCVGGHFFNFDPFSQFVDLTGESFPADPKWQGSLDAQYEWAVRDSWNAFVGGDWTVRSSTNGFFYNRAPFPAQNAQPPRVLNMPGYGLVDLRAGIENDEWRVQLWGRNVFNKYYWTSASHVNDVLYRYTGMPATYGVTLTWRFK